MFKWEISNNGGACFQVWRQTRPLEAGEPMHSGVRESRGCFSTREEAQRYADKLNAEGPAMIRVTKKKWDTIPKDYKGVWSDSHNTPAGIVGKRYVFEGCITDHASTALLTEGIHFEIT